MIKLLLALMMSVVYSLASEPPIKILEPMDYNPYDYSDARPRMNYVFNADISSLIEWETDDRYSRMDQCWLALEHILEKIDFKGLPPRHESNRLGNTDDDFIFGRLDAQQRLTECLFVHFEYSTKSRSLHLSSAECDTYDYKPAVHMTLSWRYVNTAYKSIDCSIQCYKMNTQNISEKILERIKKKGIEKSFTRIGIVMNDDRRVSFYTVFETLEEKGKGESVLRELREVLS